MPRRKKNVVYVNGREFRYLFLRKNISRVPKKTIRRIRKYILKDREDLLIIYTHKLADFKYSIFMDIMHEITEALGLEEIHITDDLGRHRSFTDKNREYFTIYSSLIKGNDIIFIIIIIKELPSNITIDENIIFNAVGKVRKNEVF